MRRCAALVALALLACQPAPTDKTASGPEQTEDPHPQERTKPIEAPRVPDDVPRGQASWTDAPIVIDGALNEAAWKQATRLGPFVRVVDGAQARQATWARVLWDAHAVYFAFEVEDDDVWARDTRRDDTTLPGDEVVEVFLDDGGEGVTYFEIEVSPANVVYDLFCLIPKAFEAEPTSSFRSLPNWDARGLKTAVRVDGTLDVVADYYADPALDADRGLTVEIAIPWRDMTAIPNQPKPPQPGAIWRLGLYRVDRPRVAAKDRAAREQAYRERAEYQAWSKVGKLDFHRPDRFGVLEFIKR